MSDQIILNPFFNTSNSYNCVECGPELDIRVQSPLLELSLEWLVELEANNLRWRPSPGLGPNTKLTLSSPPKLLSTVRSSAPGATA